MARSLRLVGVRRLLRLGLPRLDRGAGLPTPAAGLEGLGAVRGPGVPGGRAAVATVEGPPPVQQGVPGAGGVVLFDAPYTSPAWDNRTLTAGVLVDIPATFGCPSYSVYVVRLVALAPAANVRVRFGSQVAPHLVTANTQVAGVEIHKQLFIPGPQCYISPAQGSPTCWLQIAGHS